MIDQKQKRIGAIVLAAGLSTRMGRPKMIMPWKNATVIEVVVSTLVNTEVSPIIVVTGGAHQDVEKAIQHLPVQTVYNPQYRNGEMLDSLKLGLRHMTSDMDATMIVLGDQPSLEEHITREIIASYCESTAGIIIPSFQMRRGHPWLVDRPLWEQIHAIIPPRTLRDFINANQDGIRYLIVNSPSILQDLDTPEDYDKQRP